MSKKLLLSYYECYKWKLKAISLTSTFFKGLWIMYTLCFISSYSSGQDVLWGFATENGPKGAGTAFSIKSSGDDFIIRHAFSNDPLTPVGSLTKGNDGFFYGMTSEGGYGGGTIFKVEANGTNFTVIKRFDRGAKPSGHVIIGRDGYLYGIMQEGYGYLFKIRANGEDFTILKYFNNHAEGYYPLGSLIEASNGYLYGMTEKGGVYDSGTVYRIAANGAGFTTLKSFRGLPGEGKPSGGLTEGHDGYLYGMTYSPGKYNGAGYDIGYGSIFKISVDGAFYLSLRQFDSSTDGNDPVGILTKGTDGFFYGMTRRGGSYGNGTIFKIGANGTNFKVIRNFIYSTDGANPIGSLIEGEDGSFYGMTSKGGNYENLWGNGTIFKIASDGTSFTIYKRFHPNTPDGATPSGGLTKGNDGFFYGMTQSGGSSGSLFGVVFKIADDGTSYNVLKNFNRSIEGNNPYGSLVEGKDGNFYGMTFGAGINGIENGTGTGTIFKIGANGTGFTVLKGFNWLSDGANPYGSLVEASDGYLYGMTSNGGSYNGGTIFKIGANGTGFTVLRHFNSSIDGSSPHGSLIESSDGYLYGMTSNGGSYNGGTIFKIGANGTGFTVLRHFNSSTDGDSPNGSLLEGSDRNFYGMTSTTIFKIAANGTGFTILKNFNYSNDGNWLMGSLTKGIDGYFYGMASQGGLNALPTGVGGTLFKIKPDGTGFIVLRHFTWSTDGADLYGTPVADSDGYLYGMTHNGGINRNGTIFKIGLDGTGFKVLRSFVPSTDGNYTYGSLIIQRKSPITNPLPSPWKNGDIGAVARAGNASYSNGLFVLKSGGFDFYKAPDAFQYVYQPFTGNATIIAKVENIGNTHANALAGVMIREDLTASSSFVAAAVNPTNTNFMYRQGAGTPGYKQVSGSAPRWLKLSRSGNTFTSSFSSDGVNWTQIGAINIIMGSNIYVGLALTSQNNSLLNTATFSNVSVSTIPTAPTCTATGTILREYWANITGTTISTIPTGSTPTSSTQLPTFEAPTNVGDSYGQRIRGYICAPITGSYTFYIASDDHSELWLSTSDNPASKQKIASVTGYTSSRQWTKYASQKSLVVSLQAGKKYYIEALHKEGAGGDNLAVAWQTSTNTTITVIPGSVLSPFSTSSPTNQKPTISITSPTNGATFIAPASITINANASDTDGTISKVEFFSNGTKQGEDLAAPYSFTWSGVGAGSYLLTARATDNGNATSAEAALNVIVNSTTPTACSATGTILREYWANIAGSTVSTLPVGTTPTSTSQLTSFEAPMNIGDSYGQRVRGYICAPATGSYTFYIASDDNSELWLSTSDNPASKQKIASVTGWTSSRQWTKYTTQKSATITLQAGKKYYIEALHKEAAGGDNLAVAWQTPTNTTITVIPGTVLSPFVPTAPACTASGTILREYWANITGTTVSTIPVTATPTTSTQLSTFEAPSNVADNYGQRIRGYICPPATGSYTFYIASDDHSELWLSTSDNPASKQKVASVTGYTSSRQWTKYASQKSVAISLQAGKQYYIEALHKEGAGGDNLAVAWTTPANATITVIPGSVLSPVTKTARMESAEAGISESATLTLYPNPFENQLTITLGGLNGKVLVTLTDIVGKQSYQKEHQILEGQDNLEIDLSAFKLKAGIHVLRLQTEDGQNRVIKVLKK